MDAGDIARPTQKIERKGDVVNAWQVTVELGHLAPPLLGRTSCLFPRSSYTPTASAQSPAPQASRDLDSLSLCRVNPFVPEPGPIQEKESNQ